MMTSRSVIRSAALGAMLAVSSLGTLAQELKIGYVNSERVMRESNLAKAAQGKLETEFGRRERELRDATGKLQAAAEKFEKDAPMLAESERKTVEHLEGGILEFQEDAQARRNEELQAVVERANRVIKQIFESEKYDLIVQDAIHASNRIDITKKVIDALNAQK